MSDLMLKHISDTHKYAIAVSIASYEKSETPSAVRLCINAMIASVGSLAVDRTGLCDAVWSALDAIVLQYGLSDGVRAIRSAA